LNSESGRIVSKSVLADIIGMSSDAVICTDAAQCIVFFNDGASRIFGYQPAEALGRPLEMLLPAGARARHTEHMRRFGAQAVAARPMGDRQELRGVRKSGEAFPCEAAIAHSKSDEGMVFSVVLRDVTERHRADARQRLAGEAGEHFAASLDFDLTREVVTHLWVPRFALAALVDARRGQELVHTLCVATADGPTGVTVTTVEDSPESRIDGRLDHRAQVVGFDARFMTDVDPGMLAAIQAQEPTIVVSLPLIAQSQLVGWLRLFRRDAIAHDDLLIVEQIGGRAAMALENARLFEEVRRAVHDRDETLTVVSHDLRNPVNAVRMLAGAILRVEDDQALPAAVVECASVIRQAAGEIDRLIQDLLDASRVESGRLTVTLARVAAATLISDSMNTLRPLATERGQGLDTSIAPTLPEVMADQERVTQLMSNLVGNAFKFTPKGGRISVHAKVEGVDVEVTVTDTGPGIPREQIPRVFDRFWQSSRSRGGVGLGLTIARGIVERHGGRIWVEPDRREGTAIHFTLPVAQASADEVAFHPPDSA
jgi:PAS domain S-box-containing protein